MHFWGKKEHEYTMKLEHGERSHFEEKNLLERDHGIQRSKIGT